MQASETMSAKDKKKPKLSESESASSSASSDSDSVNISIQFNCWTVPLICLNSSKFLAANTTTT